MYQPTYEGTVHQNLNDKENRVRDNRRTDTRSRKNKINDGDTVYNLSSRKMSTDEISLLDGM